MDSVTDSGGRATRVLRKRVASIDSDNTSRPGTPVQSKLTAAASAKASTDSPLKPRMTRRNSTSGVATPVKTPAKPRVGTIATITESEAKTTAAASPARRTTRRRSTSSVDADVPAATTASKAPNFDTLTEEQESTTQSRITRSKSKSPQQIKSEPTSKVVVLVARSATTSTRKSLRGLSVAKVENEIVEEKKTVAKKSPLRGTKAATAKKSNDIDQLENIDPLAAKKQQQETSSNVVAEKEAKEEEEAALRKAQEKVAAAEKPEYISSKSQEEEAKETANSEKEMEVTKEKELTRENEKEEATTEAKQPKDVEMEITETELTKESAENDEAAQPKDQQKDEEEQQENNFQKDGEEQPKDHQKDDDDEEHQKDDKMADNEAEKITNEEDKSTEDPTESRVIADKVNAGNVSASTEPNKEKSILVENNENKEDDEAKTAAEEATNEGPTTQKSNLDQSCSILPMDEDDQSIMVPETQAEEQQEGEEQETAIEKETTTTEANTSEKADEHDEEVEHKPEVNEDEAHQDISNTIGEEKSNNISVKDEIPDDHTTTASNPDDVLPMDEDEPMEMDEPAGEEEEVCKTPSPKKRKSLSKVQIATPIQSSAKPRAVAFNSVGSDDECEKSIYPKTPGSAKSKSFIELDSSFQKEDGDDDSVVSVDDGSDDEVIPETQQPVKENNKKKLHSPPPKKKSSSSRMETKIEMETEEEEDVNMEDDTAEANDQQQKEQQEKQELDKEGEEDKPSKANTSSIRKSESESTTTSTKSSLNSSTRKEENETNLKWCNPSVASKGTKLDTIAAPEETKKDSAVASSKAEKSKRKKQKYLKRDEWNSDDEDVPADDDDEPLIDEDDDEVDDEAPYRRKHSFHDDEAMVAEDYESGDSMDSEERREMLENEIPVDGESIGSHTTDDEDAGDEEESENDSFIVSDDEEIDGGEDLEANTDSDDEDEEEEDGEDADELVEHGKESKKRKDKKKSYKRIQRPKDDSSSDDDEEEEAKKNHKGMPEKCDEEDDAEKNSLNNSKLSDSALRLQANGDEEDQTSSSTDQDTNKSRKEILRKLNQSDRFNKSVRDLDPDVEASPEIDKTGDDESHEKHRHHQQSSEEEGKEDEEEEEGGEGEESESKMVQSKNESMHVMRVTSDEEDENDDDENEEETNAEDDNYEEDEEIADEGDNDDSDIQNEDKENDGNKKQTSTNKLKHHNRGLSVSFGHFKPQKKDSLQKRVLQRSFTIGVRISGGEVDTAVIEAKPCIDGSNASTNPSSSSSASSANEETDDTTTGVLSTEDIRYLENYKHMPLGNPLVRTRRQSLAMPSNPELELCNSSLGIAVPAKKPKRKSLAVLSGNEFNPSQSFVHSLELRKAEYDRQSAKRKRLSKSFCATSEGGLLDASIIDLDARHLHKRSKLSLDSSLLVDSLENLNHSKVANSSKVKHSSTPHEKKKSNEKSDTSIRRILNRCDEILEAANRAKLEAKLNNKKNKMPKKNKKKAKQRLSSSPESKHERIFAPLSKDFKRKDKVKRAAAVKKALRASANMIIGKQIKIVEEDDSQEENNNNNICTKSNANENLKGRSKKLKKTPLANDADNANEHCKFRNYSTSAGSVIETMRTPEKKKKPKVIRLATGKVCVEPITPIKRTIHTCQGMEFHESPATPYGFNIEFSALDTPHFAMAAKDRKRKRQNVEEAGGKKKIFPKPQWTQSGMFVEEEIPGARAAAAAQLARAFKKQQQNMPPQCSSGYNFKQNALFRADIKRSSAREMLQLRERRPLHSNY
ncbi:protein slender lobes [Musca vetustissima]|uniref:protein slender lobes n=1 Tax=Musca vetustissima TaxID=27455 RepID=UPI002AB6A6BF|nr:protein slender lobes [Musca vetustissima]